MGKEAKDRWKGAGRVEASTTNPSAPRAKAKENWAGSSPLIHMLIGIKEDPRMVV